MMLTLKLDANKAELIYGFMENYLKLTAEEWKQYERELDELLPKEKEAQMQGWTQVGRETTLEAGRTAGRTAGRKEKAG